MINEIKPTQVKSVITSACRTYDAKISCECYDIIFKDDKMTVQKNKNYPVISPEDRGIFEQILHSYTGSPLTSSTIKEMASKIQEI